MNKLICLVVFAVALVLVGAKPKDETFSKYKIVEAYEVRPGILAMPRYSGDGQICEIGVERRLYSPERIRFDVSLSSKEIDQIVNDLVPSDERGPKIVGAGEGQPMVVNGSYSQTTEYKNVLVSALGEFSSAPKRKFVFDSNLVALIRWKDRKCQ